MLVGLMHTSAWAVYVEGEVVGVNDTNGVIIVSMKRTSDGVLYHRSISSSVRDATKKELLSLVLTAYSMGTNVVGTGPSSQWTGFRLKKF